MAKPQARETKTMQMTNDKTKTSAVKGAATDDKTSEATGASTEPKTASTSAPEETSAPKRRGAVPTMPLLAIYWRDDGKCVAAILSPRGESYLSVGRGKGTATGQLVDLGFSFGPLHNDPPAWVGDQKRIPESARVEGFANITGFPLPPQD